MHSVSFFKSILQDESEEVDSGRLQKVVRYLLRIALGQALTGTFAPQQDGISPRITTTIIQI